MRRDVHHKPVREAGAGRCVDPIWTRSTLNSASLDNRYYWQVSGTNEGAQLSHEFIDKFVRRQNVERYRRLLENVTDENRRDWLLKLLAEAKQKQKDAEDPAYLY